MRHVPLVGDVAAGTGVLAAENVEETLPVPEDFTGDGDLFMLRVRGDSMIDAGIFDGDYVVVRQPADGRQRRHRRRRHPRRGGHGEDVPAHAATRSCCGPANPTMDDMVFDPREVTIYGKVVSLLRRL